MAKKTEKKEVRKITIHGREYFLTKDQIKEELGVESDEEVEKIWNAADKVKRKSKSAKKPTKQPVKKPEKNEKQKRLEKFDAQVLKSLKKLGKTGSGEIAKDLKLTGESRRGKVRASMKRLEKAGRVEISRNKKKRYVFEAK